MWPIEDAESLKNKLGEKAILRRISKGGHLVQLERPCVFNSNLIEFLAHGNTHSS
uniref:AB hydrolase-1 domain-containing protein n=2 Tax=Aegilops tauschii TaxID=37682 RepID=R7WEG6_AEGTA